MEEERLFIETPKLTDLFVHRKSSSDDSGSLVVPQPQSQVNSFFNIGSMMRLSNNSVEK
jgi:hypothetical protein